MTIALLGSGVSACGGGSSSKASGSASGGAGTAITIKSFKFDPSPLKAKVGDTITVTNSDNTDHTATADDGSFDTGKFASGPKTITLAKAGTVAYHCNVHDYMKGTIEVSA
ncbi:MAG: hypothetical protein QOG64_2654 [Acidimicrobiaceae bacterium]|nr:hypothetical protein [Acidimicrobiaceae bacterium]